MLSRRVPYEKPEDLQFHRATYVLDVLGPTRWQLCERISDRRRSQEATDRRRSCGPTPLAIRCRRSPCCAWGPIHSSAGAMQALMAISNDGEAARPLDRTGR